MQRSMSISKRSGYFSTLFDLSSNSAGQIAMAFGGQTNSQIWQATHLPRPNWSFTSAGAPRKLSLKSQRSSGYCIVIAVFLFFQLKTSRSTPKKCLMVRPRPLRIETK